jgi:pilus assembly protein CpaB
MNKRILIVFIFAFAVAAGASMMFYRMVSAKLSSPPSTTVPKRVVAASHALEVGALIKPEDVKLVVWPGGLPVGAVVSLDVAIGRGVISPVYEDEPIIESRLATRGAGGGLASIIPEGMRAVAVRVNELVGVSGFVVPGMSVDVIVSGNPPSNASVITGTMSRTLLQDVKVLSAGAKFQKDEEGKPVSVPVVNLLVTPEQAEMLSLASAEMRIQLVLRNPLDKAIAKTRGTFAGNLFKVDTVTQPIREKRAISTPRIAPVPLATPHALEPVVIELLSGSKRTELTFPKTEKVAVSLAPTF